MQVQRMRNRRAIQQALKALPKSYERVGKAIRRLSRDDEIVDRLLLAWDRGEFEEVLNQIVMARVGRFFPAQMAQIFEGLATAAEVEDLNSGETRRSGHGN